MQLLLRTLDSIHSMQHIVEHHSGKQRLLSTHLAQGNWTMQQKVVTQYWRSHRNNAQEMAWWCGQCDSFLNRARACLLSVAFDDLANDNSCTMGAGGTCCSERRGKACTCQSCASLASQVLPRSASVAVTTRHQKERFMMAIQCY